TQVATLRAVDPATLAALRANQSDGAAVARAVSEIQAGLHVSSNEAVARLVGLRAMPAADRSYLQAHGAAVVAARARAPRQWRTWWWVCAAGQIVFLPTVLMLRGRWRLSSARRDIEQQEALIDAELARMSAAEPDLEKGGDPVGGGPAGAVTR
ncbi:MAG TPA: hypothetical protein VFH70_11575, partial [Acidimicrobiales bacterium]|nr:hypothetical protein [Acidimicrobiales bacterium]